MAGKPQNLKGKKFDKLTVIELAGRDKRGNARWNCRCICGRYITVSAPVLKANRSHTCYHCREVKRWQSRDTHRESHTRLYSIYHNMHKRCEKENAPNYHRYGGDGVFVCDDWKTYECFSSWAHNNGYEDHLTLDRIDGSKGYSPDNCRWATYREQALNMKSNHYISYNGEELTVCEWADKLGIKRPTLCARLKKYGWSVERAFTTPVGGANNSKRNGSAKSNHCRPL